MLYTFTLALAMDEQKQLLDDIEKCYVIFEKNDHSIIQFGISGYERPIYEGQHSYAAEGELKDKDGAKLTALLFADQNNHLFELELIRWSENDEDIIEPQWECFFIST